MLILIIFICIAKFIKIPNNIFHAVLKNAINLFLVVFIHNFPVNFQHLFQFILEV